MEKYQSLKLSKPIDFSLQFDFSMDKSTRWADIPVVVTGSELPFQLL